MRSFPGGEPHALAVDVEALLFYAVEVRVPYRPPLSDGAQPACGFVSTLQGNPLTEDNELKQLKPVVDTATKVWGVRLASLFMPEPCRLGAGTVHQRRRGR